ncbi:MAG: DJ-1/PfpI family protein [Anaerolineales bacterium]|nr:DJ-1/PfpI family protein [Anaerolineales bacterium]
MRFVPGFFILVAPYFDEVAVVTCLAEVRRAGFTAVLVGTTSNALNGRCGIRFHPDKSLTEISEQPPEAKQVVMIAGGAESAAVVLADPRVHQLMQQVLHHEGYVVGLQGTQQLLIESGLLLFEDSCHWLQQEEEEETAVFAQQLIRLFYKTQGV